MAEDIAPGLLAQIQEIFREECSRDKQLKRLLAAIKRGSAGYEGANAYAVRLGEKLAAAFMRVFGAAELPDGRLYYNIAVRTVAPMLGEAQSQIADAAELAQETLNQAAGIGMKPIRPALDEGRVSGIVNRVSSELYEKVSWILQEPVVEFSQSVVCDAVEANAGFQARAGLSPKLKRTVVGGCCDWCRAVAGTYDYDDAPRDIYRRHAFCRCTVSYEPGDGRRQNVHTKRWEDASEEKIEARKSIGLSTGNDKARYPINPETNERYIDHKITITNKQFGKKVIDHAADFGLRQDNAEDRAMFRAIIEDIARNADERAYGEWRDQKWPVLFHIKGEDVVLENAKGEFITILKGGITNARVARARGR